MSFMKNICIVLLALIVALPVFPTVVDAACWGNAARWRPIAGAPSRWQARQSRRQFRRSYRQSRRAARWGYGSAGLTSYGSSGSTSYGSQGSTSYNTVTYYPTQTRTRASCPTCPTQGSFATPN